MDMNAEKMKPFVEAIYKAAQELTDDPEDVAALLCSMAVATLRTFLNANDTMIAVWFAAFIETTLLERIGRAR